MKTVENLPFSYGIGKDLKRELKVAKATIKARVREAQRQRVSDALRLSVLSYDQNLDAFALQRVCAVSLVVDFGDESKAQGELLVKETKRLMEEEGFDDVFATEPEMGSYITTLFGSSPQPEDGPSFRQRVERLREKLADRLRDIPWQKIKKGAAKGASVLVILGGMAGAANSMQVDLKKAQIPPAVVEFFIVGGGAVSMGREAKKMMEKREEPGK